MNVFDFSVESIVGESGVEERNSTCQDKLVIPFLLDIKSAGNTEHNLLYVGILTQALEWQLLSEIPCSSAPSKHLVAGAQSQYSN